MRKYTKYVIVLAIFAVIYLFIGDQSLVNRIRLHYEMVELRKQRDEYKREIEAAERQIESLVSTDSLERYAREHYFMCAGNETIYVVE